MTGAERRRTRERPRATESEVRRVWVHTCNFCLSSTRCTSWWSLSSWPGGTAFGCPAAEERGSLTSPEARGGTGSSSSGPACCIRWYMRFTTLFTAAPPVRKSGRKKNVPKHTTPKVRNTRRIRYFSRGRNERLGNNDTGTAPFAKRWYDGSTPVDAVILPRMSDTRTHAPRHSNRQSSLADPRKLEHPVRLSPVACQPSYAITAASTTCVQRLTSRGCRAAPISWRGPCKKQRHANHSSLRV